MKVKPWLLYAVITTLTWGIWGALIEIPEKAGFPATLGYAVWACTMIPCAIASLKIIDWKLEYDLRSVFYGCVIGFLGAGGQVILFQALRTGPAYLVFPFISLSPVVTIILAFIILHERTDLRSWVGIILALIAIPLLSYQSPNDSNGSGVIWIILSLIVFFSWGIQAFVMRFANNHMKAESIFFYMMLSALLLIPVTIIMTDFSKPINWGFKGPWLSAMIQILNAIGALFIVYAFRYGKAIVVSPLTNAVAPLITIVISLLLYRVIPHAITITGMGTAIIAVTLMALESE